MGLETQSPQGNPASSQTGWELEIRSFELRDRRKPPPQDGIVFVGSSTITFWTELVDDFAPLPVVNRGFGGSLITDAVRYADRIVLPYRPRQVVVYSGENDLGSGRMPREVFHDYHRLADIVHATLPTTLVSFISIKYSPERWNLRDAVRVTNHLVQAYTMDHPLTSYIDVSQVTLDAIGKPIDAYYTDGIHLSREAYKLWVPVIRAGLLE